MFTNVIAGATLLHDPVSADLKLEIRNLEDLEYKAMEGFPMPGRELRLSLNVKLHSCTMCVKPKESKLGNITAGSSLTAHVCILEEES